MDNQCNTYISEALRIADDLIDFANSSEILIDDTGCSILFGVMRDCSYKIRQQAELQRQANEAKVQH